MSNEVNSSKFKDLWAIALDVKQDAKSALPLFLELVVYCETAKNGPSIQVDSCKSKILDGS